MLESHAEAIATWRERERTLFEDVFQPSAHLSPSEWAEKHRVITQGPMRGQLWSNDLTPYLVEILDFIAAPWARRGVVHKSSRVGFTEGVIMNAFGWTVAMDPCPIAIVQPTDDEAKSFSKEQVNPFLELNPIVGERFTAMGIRAADSTLNFKAFPHGLLALLGSVSDTNMRRRSFKRLLIDEVDAMRIDSKEGDPLLRFEKRTDDFVEDAGVMIVGSTPTVKGASRIDREFERSDQRYWHVHCPRCREIQILRWGGADTPYGMKWDRETCCKACGLVVEDNAVHCPNCLKAEFSVSHLAETAHYCCEFCGERIEEDEKVAMVLGGRWIATNPLGAIPGWHIDALISLFPAARWAILAAEFLQAAKDPADLQVFWNTVLGLAWEERGPDQVQASALEQRGEEHVNAAGEVVDVPDGVGVLTAFVDVQGSWLELLVRGWGLEEESWDILHQRITGAPDLDATWAVLDGFLGKRYRNVHGVEMPILCTLVDAGAYTDRVYRWTKLRQARNIFPSLGDKTGDPAHPPIRHPLKANDAGVRVVTIGTFKAKTALFRRLALQVPGPRYIHLRSYNSERCNGFDAEYFAQFESEKKVNRRPKGSKLVKPMYVQQRERNEAIDLHVGNMAAMLVIGGVRENIAAWVEAARVKPEPRPKPAAEEPPRSSSGWVSGGGAGGGGRGGWVGGWR